MSSSALANCAKCNAEYSIHKEAPQMDYDMNREVETDVYWNNHEKLVDIIQIISRILVWDLTIENGSI